MTETHNLPQQVSGKQSEIGIGQKGFANMISVKYDALPWMYLHEYPLRQRKPIQIASFETLTNPFDSYVWAFCIGCTITIFVVLVVMQKLWSRASGKASPSGYMFQGDMIDPGVIIT